MGHFYHKGDICFAVQPVSYTHLDVYKRQELDAVRQQIQVEKDEAIRDIRRQVAVLSVDIASFKIDVYKRQARKLVRWLIIVSIAMAVFPV